MEWTDKELAGFKLESKPICFCVMPASFQLRDPFCQRVWLAGFLDKLDNVPIYIFAYLIVNFKQKYVVFKGTQLMKHSCVWVELFWHIDKDQTQFVTQWRDPGRSSRVQFLSLLAAAVQASNRWRWRKDDRVIIL